MLRLMIAAALAAGVIAPPREARADWQYTRWGMTPAEVAEAAKGRTRAVNDRGKDAEGVTTLLSAPHKAGRFAFTAYFRFGEDGRLRYVDLELHTPERCPELMGGLRDSQGGPVRQERPDDVLHRVEWRDTRGGNAVTLTQIGDGRKGYRSCNVLYQKLEGEAGEDHRSGS